MSTGTPSNTIDFQRAKMVARIIELSPRLEAGDDIPSRLTRKLQTTLEIAELIRMFVEALSEVIEVEGVRYLNEAPHLHLQSERFATHRCHYRLNIGEEQLGEISFSRNKRFLEPELQVIEQLLGTLVFPLRNALNYRAAMEAAHTDQLTNIGNKRAFDLSLNREMELAKRHSSELGLILFDLDFFKKVNDTYGHATGDEVLRETARRIKETCRQSDLCFRVGGEEFALILSATGRDGVRVMAERIRKTISETPIEVGELRIAATLSLGLTTYHCGETINELVVRADRALYRAKQLGRNRAVQSKAHSPSLDGTVTR